MRTRKTVYGGGPALDKLSTNGVAYVWKYKELQTLIMLKSRLLLRMARGTRHGVSIIVILGIPLMQISASFDILSTAKVRFLILQVEFI